MSELHAPAKDVVPVDEATNVLRLLFIAMLFAGLMGASWLIPLIGAIALFLLDWPRCEAVVLRAAGVDLQFRKLAVQLWPHNPWLALEHYVLGCQVPFVLARKLGQDVVFTGTSYLLGCAVSQMGQKLA